MMDTRITAHDILDFTKAYQSAGTDIVARELAALRLQARHCFLPLQAGERLAGHYRLPALCFHAQASGYVYCYDEPGVEKLIGELPEGSDLAASLREASEFWRHEQTSVLTREAYPDWLQTALPSDDYDGSRGIAFPLYRMSGTQLNYRKLVKLGLPGLRRLITDQMALADAPG
mgnify:CR=1 FL=1